MDVRNDSLLHRLVGSPDGADATKADLQTALQHMEVTSVFDIARMSKTQFTQALARHSDADGAQVYDNATNHARQISRLYQEHRVSSGANPPRSKRGLKAGSTSEPTGYQALFEENWDQFCSEGDIAAIDSPVAYLRALYLFAGELENRSPHADRITLAQRRPDLKALMLDRQSAFVTRPMLDIINDTLRSNIEAHLANTHENRTVHQVLASAPYPFSLPYDLHHHQCVLGLGTGTPTLGELNYRVSLNLPFSERRHFYGNVFVDSAQAQKLLSGLSPAQQALLIAPTASQGNLSTLKTYYGTDNLLRLSELEFFKERTGLTTEQVEELLAQGKCRPRTSNDSPLSTRTHYGASYINGGATPALAIETQAEQKVFTHNSPERFDRLQRMIRLHRWTGIPVAELDTLVFNVQRSEMLETLSANTLRTLGVYRYLNRRHGIAPEEFAAFLHDMPTHACGDRVSLFDQVFNRTQLLKSPMWGAPRRSLTARDEQTFSYLSAGLGLPVAPDSLLLLTEQASRYLSLEYDLPTVSALYRQARIARMFRLSPLECTELARLLGGEDFCKALVKGELRTVDSTKSDILDVLMAMDWAVDWLRQNNRDVLQWCRLFNVSSNDWPLNQNLEKRLAKFQADTNASQDHPHQVELLLHDIADLPAEYVPGVLQMAGTDARAIVAAIKQAPGAMPPLLATVLRTAEACQRLHLSSSTLKALMENPTWLAPRLSATLRPHTLYLLECFSHCARHQAQSEENLLHYLQVANQEHSEKEANGLLAKLLNWSVEEVSSLTASLDTRRANSMEAVDWIMRCQACSQQTGLSANLLIKALRLKATSPASDWKIVGEALIAACH
ncbi:Tc toxin subunit A [Pseudomonas thivervalensis]|uniref:Tc toxin subunit A n=1 Tax=Pseudomonas thivervalensis TaxID=86265 RepID=UPI00069DE9D3|nr:Tc toxin subunit A [Pseudomonas thivervalensis]OAB52860.1 toxin [Pseudomonas thivervalensis]SDG17037.1 virulence plasmid A protein [Pseudomonas thivervalensis]